MHLDPIEHNLLFIEGIRHHKKKDALLQKWMMTKDMDLVLQEAVALESTLDTMKLWDQASPKEGKNNQKSNVDINAITASGNGKAGKQQQQQNQQQQQQQNQQQPQQQLSKTQ